MKLLQQINFIVILLAFTNTYAQLDIDAQLRPRLEYRHGYKTLFPDNEDAAVFVSQRTRLNTKFKTEKLSFYLSLQDVRVWGDVPQLNTADNNGIGLHQAWGEILFNTNFSLKIGRQEIVYDDHRFLGNVDWAQQARSHDAVLLKYKHETVNLDFGAAFNQDEEALTGTTLTTNGTYKSLQYLWLHKDWKNFNTSFLFLNNGLQFIDIDDEDHNETRYGQTIGSHLKFNKNKLSINGNLYYQFGKDLTNNTLSAYLVGLEASYNQTSKFNTTLGVELQSGNENGTPSNNKNQAFTPLYGTNHKFNGYMDYFYVGNHNNNVGLFDIYAKANWDISHKSKLNINVHQFSAAEDLASGNSKTLGTEIDLVFNYNYQKDINFKAGYSQMFASEGLEILKNNNDGKTNNWGWIMIIINPTLFTSDNI